MKKVKQINTDPFVVVINKHGEVYIGMREGRFQWSNNWNEAKPLHANNTEYLKRMYNDLELIDEKEIFGKRK